MNCKFLETEKITEFIVLNEEQDPIIIMPFNKQFLSYSLETLATLLAKMELATIKKNPKFWIGCILSANSAIVSPKLLPMHASIHPDVCAAMNRACCNSHQMLSCIARNSMKMENEIKNKEREPVLEN